MATEISSSRNVTLMQMISDVGSKVADLARWPDSEATRTTADNSIKLLRKVFAESGYPHAFLYMGMLQIAADVYSENVYRSDMKPQALKQAWIKIADLLYKDKSDASAA